MKLKVLILLLSCFLFINKSIVAQTNTEETDVYYKKIYVVQTFAGREYVGELIKQDEREVILETKEVGRIAIPKLEIKTMKPVEEGQLGRSGEYMPDEVFSTRYFLTTNGLPLKKGENYVLWNLYGPEIHFGLSDNLGVGLMTTWIGMPIIGSVKYSFKLNEKMSCGLGTLVGTGSWASPDFALGLPYAALTYGDRRTNISFSGGYGVIAYGGNADGNALLSVAGMAKISSKFSFVFDSFIVPDVRFTNSNYNTVTGVSTTTTTYSPVALIIPGFRIQSAANKAFQFGFAGIYGNNEITPIPIPFVQWFRKF